MLCYYVSYLAREKLRHKTIKVYLSAVRYLHVAERGGDPFQAPMVRLQWHQEVRSRGRDEKSGEAAHLAGHSGQDQACVGREGLRSGR